MKYSRNNGVWKFLNVTTFNLCTGGYNNGEYRYYRISCEPGEAYIWQGFFDTLILLNLTNRST